jgi:Protein of unknown function (DUF2637)
MSTASPTGNPSLPISPTFPGEAPTMDGMANGSHTKNRPMDPVQMFTVVFIVGIVAVVLIAYGAAASYDNLWHLALSRGVPLPRLMPVGLDGGLVGTVALDLVLTWIGYPLWWLRTVARLFALGTVAANALAGWPDPVGMFLRIAAPALIVIITEALRAVLLKRRREQAGNGRIPAARWVLAFRSTFSLWRRMKLWGVTDYAEGLATEMRRLQAVESLTVLYQGKDWREQVPGDLAWMLTQGVFMDEALKRVGELTTPPECEPAAAGSPVTAARRPRVTKARKSTPPSTRDTGVPADVDIQAEALKILDAEPTIGGRELGKRLGVDPSYGCRLKKRLTQPAPATGEQPRVSEES